MFKKNKSSKLLIAPLVLATTVAFANWGNDDEEICKLLLGILDGRIIFNSRIKTHICISVSSSDARDKLEQTKFDLLILDLLIPLWPEDEPHEQNSEDLLTELNVSDELNKPSKIIGITAFTAIPITGCKGDNIAAHSDAINWYSGPTLMAHLEGVDLDQNTGAAQEFRMPVQWVNRPNLDFRGFSGKIAAGTIKPGDEVRILPSGKTSHVDRIVTYDGDLDSAIAGQSITLTLKDEVDCSRGQVITAASAPLEVADQFETTLIWMDEEALIPGRSYYLKIGAQTVSATVAEPKYQINVNTMEHAAAKTLELNAIGVANVTTDRDIPFAPYAENRTLGGFILIDKMTNATVGAGLINFALRRAQNIHWQATDITRDHHANLKNQKPAVLWMTGLSGSGQSTSANEDETKLASTNRNTFPLDG